MRLVVDTNILIAALLRDGITRKLLRHPSLDLYTPLFAFQELTKHEQLLSDHRASRPSNMEEVLQRIQVVDDVELLPFRNEAWRAVAAIDPNDVEFIACALAISGSVLWSHDVALRQQPHVAVLSTSELIKKLHDEHLL